jgi:hypothetical protein
MNYREVYLVGAGGFEPPTSRTRTVRSNRAEPRPELFIVYHERTVERFTFVYPYVMNARFDGHASIKRRQNTFRDEGYRRVSLGV